jgi:hypothetical protein
MKMSKIIPLDFEVDKLTNSIINTLTGETFDTDILPLKKDVVLSKIEWVFDWEQELEERREEKRSVQTRYISKSLLDSWPHQF